MSDLPRIAGPGAPLRPRWRAVRRLLLAAAAAAWASGVTTPQAGAQDRQGAEAAKSEIGSLLRQIEVLMMDNEALKMAIAQFEPRARNYRERLADYNARIEQHNGYCQGTWPEPEYSARVRTCATEGSGLDSIKRQLQSEEGLLTAEQSDLKRRDETQSQKGQELWRRLGLGVKELVTACMTLSLGEQQDVCHVPAAPGPRTGEMVRGLEGRMTAALRQ